MERHRINNIRPKPRVVVWVFVAALLSSILSSVPVPAASSPLLSSSTLETAPAVPTITESYPSTHDALDSDVTPSFTIPPGTLTYTATFIPTLTPTPRINVDVYARFADGAAIPKFQVRLVPFTYEPVLGYSGRARLRVPAGNYSMVYVECWSGGSVGPTAGKLFTYKKPLEITKYTKLNYTLKTYSFRGRIASNDGGPLGPVNITSVFLYKDSNGALMLSSGFVLTTKGPNNAFNIRLAPLEYIGFNIIQSDRYFGASFPGFTPGRDNTSVVFTVERGARITGSIGFSNDSAALISFNYLPQLYAVPSWIGSAFYQAVGSSAPGEGVIRSQPVAGQWNRYSLLLPKKNNYTIFWDPEGVRQSWAEVPVAPVARIDVTSCDVDNLNVVFPVVAVDFRVLESGTGKDVIGQAPLQVCTPLGNRTCSCRWNEDWSDVTLTGTTWTALPGIYKFGFGLAGLEFEPACSEVIVLQGAKKHEKITLRPRRIVRPVSTGYQFVSGNVTYIDDFGIRRGLPRAGFVLAAFHVSGNQLVADNGFWSEEGEFLFQLPRGGPYSVGIIGKDALFDFNGTSSIFDCGCPDGMLVKKTIPANKNVTNLYLDVPVATLSITIVSPANPTVPMNVWGNFEGYTDIKASGGLGARVIGNIENGRGSAVYQNISLSFHLLDYGWLATTQTGVLKIVKSVNKTVVIYPRAVILHIRLFQPDGTVANFTGFVSFWPQVWPKDPAHALLGSLIDYNSDMKAFTVLVTPGQAYKVQLVYRCTYDIDSNWTVLAESVTIWKDTLKQFTLPTATWSGTVVDTRGKPVKGAVFNARPRGGQLCDRDGVSAVTDARGKFTIRYLRKTVYTRVSISLPREGDDVNWETVTGFPDFSLSKNTDRKYTMVIKRPQLTGVVKLKGGVVITEGNLVAVCDRGHVEGDGVRIGRDGRYELRPPYNVLCNISIYFESHGFTGASVGLVTNLRLTSNRVRDFVIDATLLKGRVVDLKGKPVKGARFVAVRQHFTFKDPTGSSREADQLFAVTDDQGKFEIRAVKAIYEAAAIWPPMGSFSPALPLGKLELKGDVLEKTFVYKNFVYSS